ncbi:hypothetical protein K2173_013864 [Erythroxylum novogranatense]|uniref:Endonuclease/exonuclease/phosphatase domain-containing protein n=1 Tax=Erythroxylum novogranatense TaxID=1862640 RepID=A0AAV8SCU9_9ROSI|nr:hypothetical protein K2173_013864 [Erythroxylum novogranatense]
MPMTQASLEELVKRVETEEYGSWMVVKRKPRVITKPGNNQKSDDTGVKFKVSRFDLLAGQEENELAMDNLSKDAAPNDSSPTATRINNIRKEQTGSTSNHQGRKNANEPVSEAQKQANTVGSIRKGPTVTNFKKVADGVTQITNTKQPNPVGTVSDPEMPMELEAPVHDNPVFVSDRETEDQRGAIDGERFREIISMTQFQARKMGSSLVLKQNSVVRMEKNCDPKEVKKAVGDAESSAASTCVSEAVAAMIRTVDNLQIEMSSISGSGCGNSKFHHFLSEYRREHNMNLIALLETRISGKNADSVVAKLGYPYSHRVEANGFVGGIWILWDDYITVDIIFNHSQLIHARVKQVNASSFCFITFVYGSSQIQGRKKLWENLSLMAELVQGPWMFTGDFNSILFTDERKGGPIRNPRRCRMFQEFMFETGLQDIGFNGPKFTWCRGSLFQRSDRAVVNGDWEISFPNTSVTHLERLKSDHRRLLISFGGSQSRPRDRPFRFFSGWLEHESFAGLVKDKWDDKLPIAHTVY